MISDFIKNLKLGECHLLANGYDCLNNKVVIFSFKIKKRTTYTFTCEYDTHTCTLERYGFDIPYERFIYFLSDSDPDFNMLVSSIEDYMGETLDIGL